MSSLISNNASAANVQILDAQAAQAKNGIDNPRLSANKRKAHEAAEQFEAVFLSQMLSPMFETVKTDSMMGGGNGEDVFRSMMVQQMGKAIAKKGGIGIADQVYREILKMQEE
ncbi:rod-binding protein [Kordiimonas marina]|uniref:rod-binding protein n=1 Tax=Kordiimonas marina TaxID=2872312 RepID=UPI001FF21CA8|nr:rod-binding protein [Kordiimonas marina]MCJ9430333.1 rod-binding protein [Kordiimonas marina]